MEEKAKYSKTKVEGITKAASGRLTKPETTKRTLDIPNSLYYDVIDANTDMARQGIKRTKEEEIYALLEEGLKFRRMMAATKGVPLTPAEKKEFAPLIAVVEK